MCMLCVEIQKKNMNVKEVARAFQEFDVPQDHMSELTDVIDENYGIEPVTKELNEIYKTELKRRSN